MAFELHTAPIEKNLFIEASAGTGKTYAIEHLIVRRLIESTEGCKPLTMDQIAVVTFTRACKEELCDRIWATCKKVEELLTKEDFKSEFPFIEKIKARGRKVISETRQRLQLALQAIPQATISTIHSFCLTLLSDYENRRYVTLKSKDIEQKILDYICYELQEELFSPEQLALLIKEEGSVIKLVQAIRKNLWVKAKKSPVRSPSEISDSLFGVIKNLGWSKEYVEERLDALSYQYKNVRTREGIVKPDIQKRFTCFSKLFSPESSIKDVIYYPLYIDEIFAFPKVKAATKPDQFKELVLKNIQPYIKELSCKEILLEKLVTLVEQFLERFFESSNEIALEVILNKMLESLKNDDFLEYVRGRFSLIIVDEFQDTDLKQWEMIKKICIESRSWKGNLYLVGDPKQSIYRFRGADVYSYLEARESMGSDATICHLTTNYRSQPKLNQALNTIFAKNQLQNLFYLPLRETSVEVKNLDSISSDASDPVPLTFFITYGEAKRAGIWPSKEIEEQFIFPYIAQEIRTNNQNAQSTAILVKDRYQAKRVVDFLSKQGIDSVSHRIDKLVDTEAYAFLRRLLFCLRKRRNRGAIVQLVGAYPFLFNEDQLFSLKSKTNESQQLLAHILERLNQMREVLQKSVALFFELLLAFLPPDVDPLFVSHLEQLFDYVVEAKVQVLGDLEDLLDHMPTQPEDEAPAAKMEERKGAVEVLTIHRSKGLEFDTVFALGVASRTVISEDIEEADVEKIRQFYVAATRAKKKLYLPVVIDSNERSVEYGRASSMELFLATGAITNTHKEQRHKELYQKMREKDLISSLEAIIESDSEKSIRIHRIEQKMHFTKVPPIKLLSKNLEEKTRAPVFNYINVKRELINSFSSTQPNFTAEFSNREEVLPQGALTGVIIHSLLEKICLSLKNNGFDLDRLRKVCRDEILKTEFLDKVELIDAIIQNLTNLEFSDGVNSFTFKDISWQHSFAERPFFYKDGSSVIRGVVDLVFEVNEKSYVLDWKTNVVADGYGRESLQKYVENHGYDKQADVYLTAWNKYLTFCCKKQSEGCFFVFIRGLIDKQPSVVFVPNCVKEPIGRK